MLCYTDDGTPGLTRRRRGKGWQYLDAKGRTITDKAEVARLNKLAVPPAYEKVWYCPHGDGHLLATGLDARGRKQYRYHEDFRAKQDADKYDRCVDFAQALPKLRAAVERDLNGGRGLTRTRVLAAVVRLLDVGHVRIGNDAYAKSNKSYGATTLRNRHATATGGTVRLSYKGKHGLTQEVEIEDAVLARLVRRCQDLPGQHLFQYVGDDGEPHRVDSSDVNEYIRDAMGEAFTAKHFRTWGASVIAFEAIAASDADAPISLKQMLEPVAAALGNTPAISRKSYVHPLLIERVKDGDVDDIAGAQLPRAMKHLSPEERGLVALLEAAAKPRRRKAA